MFQCHCVMGVSLPWYKLIITIYYVSYVQGVRVVLYIQLSGEKTNVKRLHFISTDVFVCLVIMIIMQDQKHFCASHTLYIYTRWIQQKGLIIRESKTHLPEIRSESSTQIFRKRAKEADKRHSTYPVINWLAQPCPLPSFCFESI